MASFDFAVQVSNWTAIYTEAVRAVAFFLVPKNSADLGTSVPVVWDETSKRLVPASEIPGFVNVQPPQEPILPVTIPSRGWYAIYTIDNVSSLIPVVYFLAKTPEDPPIGMVWNLQASSFVDGKTINGFAGYVMSNTIEAHFQATVEDMIEGVRKVIGVHTNISAADIKGLIDTAVTQKLAGIIADKLVKNVLVEALPI